MLGPAVDDGTVGDGWSRMRGLPVGEPRIHRLERHRVPVGEEGFADDVTDRRMADPSCLPWGAAGQHEPADGVRAMIVHEADRLKHISDVLAHLAAILIEDMSEAQHISV